MPITKSDLKAVCDSYTTKPSEKDELDRKTDDASDDQAATASPLKRTVSKLKQLAAADGANDIVLTPALLAQLKQDVWDSYYADDKDNRIKMAERLDQLEPVDFLMLKLTELMLCEETAFVVANFANEQLLQLSKFSPSFKKTLSDYVKAQVDHINDTDLYVIMKLVPHVVPEIDMQKVFDDANEATLRALQQSGYFAKSILEKVAALELNINEAPIAVFKKLIAIVDAANVKWDQLFTVANAEKMTLLLAESPLLVEKYQQFVKGLALHQLSADRLEMIGQNIDHEHFPTLMKEYIAKINLETLFTESTADTLQIIAAFVERDALVAFAKQQINAMPVNEAIVTKILLLNNNMNLFVNKTCNQQADMGGVATNLADASIEKTKLFVTDDNTVLYADDFIQKAYFAERTAEENQSRRKRPRNRIARLFVNPHLEVAAAADQHELEPVLDLTVKEHPALDDNTITALLLRSKDLKDNLFDYLCQLRQRITSGNVRDLEGSCKEYNRFFKLILRNETLRLSYQAKFKEYIGEIKPEGKKIIDRISGHLLKTIINLTDATFDKEDSIERFILANEFDQLSKLRIIMYQTEQSEQTLQTPPVALKRSDGKAITRTAAAAAAAYAAEAIGHAAAAAAAAAAAVTHAVAAAAAEDGSEPERKRHEESKPKYTTQMLIISEDSDVPSSVPRSRLYRSLLIDEVDFQTIERCRRFYYEYSNRLVNNFMGRDTIAQNAEIVYSANLQALGVTGFLSEPTAVASFNKGAKSKNVQCTLSVESLTQGCTRRLQRIQDEQGVGLGSDSVMADPRPVRRAPQELVRGGDHERKSAAAGPQPKHAAAAKDGNERTPLLPAQAQPSQQQDTVKRKSGLSFFKSCFPCMGKDDALPDNAASTSAAAGPHQEHGDSLPPPPPPQAGTYQAPPVMAAASPNRNGAIGGASLLAAAGGILSASKRTAKALGTEMTPSRRAAAEAAAAAANATTTEAPPGTSPFKKVTA